MTTLLQVKLQSPLGELEVLSTDRGLCALLFEDYRDTITARIDRRFAEHSILSGDPFGAAPALEAWLGGHLQALDTIPIDPGGTPFQRSVWRALQSIPPGQTRSYGQIALSLDRTRAARAVGAANGANPLPLFVPCHRVLGARGALTGFAFGLTRKKWLLDFERRHA